MNNDKIKQLAEDAGYCYAPVDEGYENRDSYNSFDYKEFALLILEECITQCRLAQSQILVGMNTDFSVGKDMGMEVCIDAIKEYFMEDL